MGFDNPGQKETQGKKGYTADGDLATEREPRAKVGVQLDSLSRLSSSCLGLITSRWTTGQSPGVRVSPPKKERKTRKEKITVLMVINPADFFKLFQPQLQCRGPCQCGLLRMNLPGV